MKAPRLGLWDLLRRRPDDAVSSGPRKRPMQRRYDALVAQMKATYGIRVLRWRSSTSGCAWELHDRHGGVSRMIESPYPRGPVSCSVFLHEVGHHAIGFKVYRPRCLEEYHAWAWSLQAMEANGFSVTSRVLKRRDNALRYAVGKALRRGLRSVPDVLVAYLPESAVLA